jgi:tetratricopeptide (TPR) repeat protein
MDRPADFFVSYTSADRAWAEWIAWQLEAEGYRVIVQAWDFTPGRSWTHEMQQATATAERVVAVLSAAYLKSEQGEAEWEVFQAKDPLGERGLLLPVRVGDVDPPGLLKTRIYIDLVGLDAASARSALLAAARGTRGKPTDEPEFPGAQPPSHLSAREEPGFPSALPPVWNVPFHPNPFFAGRDRLLTELRARLTGPEATSRRVVLIGLGGVGKTRLAVEYAYHRQDAYDLVWWVRGEQPSSLIGDSASLAGQPPLATDVRLGKDVPQVAVAAAVRGWLERNHRWLLVLDNVEEPSQVADLLPRSATGHVLMTSRAETTWESLADPLPVDVLSATDAAYFLLNRTAETGPRAEASAATVAGQLEGLPLALEQAAAYITATGVVDLAGYSELFDNQALELLQRGQPLGYKHTVATTWSLALQSLKETAPAAVALLTLASFLAPDDLPQQLLTAHPGVLPEPLASLARNRLALADAFAALRRYSLVAVKSDVLTMHRLVQLVTRQALVPDEQQQWATVAVRLVLADFPEEAGDDAVNWPKAAQLLIHALTVTSRPAAADGDPEATVTLLNRMGDYLWGQAQYDRARKLLEKAIDLAENRLGPNHLQTAQGLHNLAHVLSAQGNLDDARTLHERALAIRETQLGPNHPDTLQSMSNLASVRKELEGRL